MAKKARPLNPKWSMFGSQWDEIPLPATAVVSLILDGDKPEIGLSAMQLDNIGYDAAVASVTLEKDGHTVAAEVYNACRMGAHKKPDGVTITDAVAKSLHLEPLDTFDITGLIIQRDKRTNAKEGKKDADS